MFSPTQLRISFRSLAAIAVLVALSACGGSDTPSVAEIAESDSPASGSTEAVFTDNGGGTIVIDGIDYVFETQFCADDEDGIFNQGAGVTADGTPFAANIFVQSVLDRTIVTIEVIVGQDGLFGIPSNDQPYYEANSFRDADLDATVEGTRVFGSGTAADLNGVALADGETVSISFDGQCG